VEQEVLRFRGELRVMKAAYSSEGEVAEQRAARGVIRKPGRLANLTLCSKMGLKRFPLRELLCFRRICVGGRR